ncbi:MAG: OmpA family protein [Planctomycetes bacterium]|nr:OmpA family protein [Planctomycetota bacterium]
MPRRKRRPPLTVDTSAPHWMVTFTDLMMLLMVFFILLFSMSIVQEVRFKAARDSFRANLGFLLAHESVRAGGMNPAFAREHAAAMFKEGVPGEHLEVLTVDEGRKIVVGGKVLFATGSGELLPGSDALLYDVADRVRGFSNRIEIRGHAAPGETAGSDTYEDEWALGWARARAVADFLVARCNIPANRLRLASGGSADPAAPNLLSGKASPNRRVEVVATGEFIR